MLPFSLVSQFINTFLQNRIFRIVVVVITSVFTGYTLYPVPQFLDSMFYTSSLFKYLILMFAIASSMYPLNEQTVLLAVVVPAVVLYTFHFLRKYNEKGNLRDALKASVCK